MTGGTSQRAGQGRGEAVPRGLSELARLLHALPPSCGTAVVVAIDGPSGAGKSTFADRLATLLPEAVIIRSDDFPVPWDGDPLAWWPPLVSQILRPLSLRQPARFRPYRWQTGSYGDQVTIAADLPLLLLDGVGAAQAASPASYRIWVETPYELRRRRALDRDGTENAKAWDTWSRREAAHFGADRTRERADLLVDGTTGRLGAM